MLNGAMPAFDLSDGGLWLPAVRSLSVIALFQTLGALAFLVAIVPRALRDAAPEVKAAAAQRIARLVWSSLLAGVVGLLGWTLFQAAIMSNADTLVTVASGFARVLTGTSFGHVIALQLAALAATGIAFRLRRSGLALFAAAAATLLQVGHSHAFSMVGGADLLLLSDALHFLAGAIWLGGLLPLLLVIRAAPGWVGALACRHYSPIGKMALATVAGSAGYQGYVMAGGFVGLVGTAYGWVALTKLMLLAMLTGFAIVNRYRLAPALLGADPVGAHRMIVRSMVAQTGTGVLVMVAASLLSSLPPGMHLEPVWPFRSMPSLIVLGEDPDVRAEVIGAAFAVVAALFAFGLAAFVRRWHWMALGGGALLVLLAAPHLSPLMVEAYPTSFYHSPTGFAAAAIAEGGSLYPANCARCHGTDGTGHGPDAKGLAIPPADLTAPHLWAHADGELFWWLSHGIDAPEGGLAMPGFASTLDENQRWALIDYIRAHNAGVAHRTTGTWSMPVVAPGFRARCPDGQSITLGSLRGHVVVLRFEPAAVTVQVADGPDCAVSDRAVIAAYEVITGSREGVPADTAIVIDANGWLRDVGSYTGQDLEDRIRAIRDHPLATRATSAMHHHMGG